MAIEAKLVTITNDTIIQGRPLTLVQKIEDGKEDLIRMNFNGKGEIFSFPASDLDALVELFQKMCFEVGSAKEVLASTNQSI